MALGRGFYEMEARAGRSGPLSSRTRKIGLREIGALEQQRRSQFLRQRIGEGVAVIQRRLGSAAFAKVLECLKRVPARA